MHIIIDFDYTLFDTNALRRAVLDALQPFGVNASAYQQAERAAKRSDDAHFTFDAQLKYMFPDAAERAAAVEAVAPVLTDTSFALYPDSIAFLKRHAVAGNRITIFSYGHVQWIEQKIAASGAAAFADTVIATDVPKEQRLPQLLQQERTAVLNDRGSEIDAMAAIAPHVDYILIRRPGAPYSDEACVHAAVTYRDLSFTLQ